MASIFKVTTLLTVIWIAYRAGLYLRKDKQSTAINWKKELIVHLFMVYAIVLFFVTMIPLPLSTRNAAQIPYNFIPVLNTVAGFREAFHSHIFSQLVYETSGVVGNILLFVPMGALLPFFLRQQNFRATVLSGMGISAAIELTQLISRHFGTYRFCDIDDVLLNTIGTGLGFTLFRLASTFRFTPGRMSFRNLIRLQLE